MSFQILHTKFLYLNCEISLLSSKSKFELFLLIINVKYLHLRFIPIQTEANILLMNNMQSIFVLFVFNFAVCISFRNKFTWYIKHNLTVSSLYPTDLLLSHLLLLLFICFNCIYGRVTRNFEKRKEKQIKSKNLLEPSFVKWQEHTITRSW